MDRDFLDEQRKMLADMLDAGQVDGKHRAKIMALLEDLFKVANGVDAITVGVQMMGCQHGRQNKGEIHAIEFTIVLPPSPEHRDNSKGLEGYQIIAKGEPPKE